MEWKGDGDEREESQVREGDRRVMETREESQVMGSDRRAKIAKWGGEATQARRSQRGDGWLLGIRRSVAGVTVGRTSYLGQRRPTHEWRPTCQLTVLRGDGMVTGSQHRGNVVTV